MVFKKKRIFSQSKSILFFVFEGYIPICKQSTAAQQKKEPEKIEVFVDGKPIHVEPNITVLQVIEYLRVNKSIIIICNFYYLGLCCCWCRNSSLLLS
jgi:hypothetical protein